MKCELFVFSFDWNWIKPFDRHQIDHLSLCRLKIYSGLFRTTCRSRSSLLFSWSISTTGVKREAIVHSLRIDETSLDQRSTMELERLNTSSEINFPLNRRERSRTFFIHEGKPKCHSSSSSSSCGTEQKLFYQLNRSQRRWRWERRESSRSRLSARHGTCPANQVSSTD